MIQISDMTTSWKDIHTVKTAFWQSIKKLPHLLYSNSLFILAVILLEILYSYFLIWGANNALLVEITRSCFSLLAGTFLIFLVPFQLHKLHLKDPASRPQFFHFVQKTVMPIVEESLIALAFLIGYGAVCMIILISFFVILYFIDPSLLSNLENLFSPQDTFSFLKSLLLGLVIFTIMLPVAIRFIQFHFIPYIIFFSSAYTKTKNAVKLSIQISKKLALPFHLLISGSYIIIAQINRFLPKKNILTDINLANLSIFITNILISHSWMILFFAMYYFLYKARDPQYLS